MSKFIVSVFLLRLAIGTLGAEEVRVYLDNGDAITGELVSRSEGAIVLRVDYLGTVEIPRERVARSEALASSSVEPEAEPEEAEAAVAVVDAAASQAKRPAGERPETGGEAVAQAAAEAEPGLPVGSTEAPGGWWRTIASAFKPLPNWDKRLQFGFNSHTGRKVQTDLNYRLDMNRKLEDSQLRMNAEYSYGKANGAKTVDRLKSNLRWRKDIGPGVFYETLTLYSWDNIKQIDSNVEQKLGLGTRFVDNEASVVSAGLGASGRWRDFQGQEEEVAYLVDVFQDWDYKMSERIRVKQDFKFAVPLEASDEYEVTFSAALTSEVTESINVSVRYELGYDNSLVDSLKEDRRFISALGYSF